MLQGKNGASPKKSGIESKVALPIEPKYSDFFTSTPTRRDNDVPHTISASIAGSVFRDIEVLLVHERDKFPFNTISDFVRWAVEFGVTYAARVAENGKILNSAAKRKALCDSIILRQQHLDFLSVMDLMEKNAIDMDARGHHQPLIESLMSFQASIQRDMGDDPYWQDMYMKEFERRFERFLPKVSLRNFSEEE